MIGQKIKFRMKELGHTTRSLSEATGIARNTILKITNDRNYEVKYLHQICEALYLDVIVREV